MWEMLNTVIITVEECVGGWIQMSCSRVAAADDLFTAGDTLMLNDWSPDDAFMYGTISTFNIRLFILLEFCFCPVRGRIRASRGISQTYLWARKISVTITSKYQLCQDPPSTSGATGAVLIPCEISYHAPCPVIHLTSSGSDPPERVTANCSHITSFRRQRRQQQQHHSVRSKLDLNYERMCRERAARCWLTHLKRVMAFRLDASCFNLCAHVLRGDFPLPVFVFFSSLFHL